MTCDKSCGVIAGSIGYTMVTAVLLVWVAMGWEIAVPILATWGGISVICCGGGACYKWKRTKRAPGRDEDSSVLMDAEPTTYTDIDS